MRVRSITSSANFCERTEQGRHRVLTQDVRLERRKAHGCEAGRMGGGSSRGRNGSAEPRRIGGPVDYGIMRT